MIKEFDVVLLSDGRRGTVLEIYEQGGTFLLEIVDGSGKTLETPTVPARDVQKILYSA